MKKLYFALLIGLSHLGLASEIELDRAIEVTSGFSPVVATQDEVARVAMGQRNPNLLKIVSMRGGSTGDKTSLFTHLGGTPSPTDILSVSSTDILVAGSVLISGSLRLFVTRINLTMESPVWTFVETPRTQSTRGLQLLDTGISFVVAAEMEGGFGAIAFNPSTGAEQWRTTIPSTNRRARVARDGSENVYIVGSKSRPSGDTDLFVRSVNDGGNFRWERTFTEVAEGAEVVNFSDPVIVVGFTRGFEQSTFRLATVFAATLENLTGNILSTASRSLGGPGSQGPTDLEPPVMAPALGRVMLSTTYFDAAVITERALLSFAPNLSGGIREESRPAGVAAVATARGSRGYFAVKLPQGGSEFWRETDALSTGYSPAMNTPSDMVFDSKDRIITVGPDGKGGVIIRRDFVRPIAVDDKFDAKAGDNLTVNAPGVLANDVTARGATLSLITQPTGGTVTLNPDGGFTYLSTKLAHGPDTFTYRLTAGSLTSTATVTIMRQPRAIGMELSPSRVKGGTQVTARVVMSGPRFETPQNIPVFESSSATALNKTSVNVPVGQAFSEPFTVFTAAVRTPVDVLISGNDGDDSADEIAILKIDPPLITTIEAIRTTVVGGAPAEFRLILDSIAPANGMPIAITDDSTAILVPSTAVVPAGLTAGIFSAPTAVVTSSKTATVTASSNGVTKSVTIAIVGVSLALNPTSVVGGQNSTGTITLTSNAIINSVFFDVTDNSPATAPDPATAVVPAGTRVGTFNIITAPVTSARTSTISIANGGVVRSASLTVRVAALQSLVVSPAQVVGGSPYAGLITLDGKAAGTGVTVGLTSANPIVQVPASQLISAGNTQALFVGSTTRPTTTLMIVITASLNGVTRPTTLIVSP